MELSDQNKEIQVVWAEEEKQRLERSLLGVCVKPIEFRDVMYHVLDEWKGSRKIECRDIGPYRCLLTFDSPENRDEAFNSELFMGMPICLWCKENFERIASLWGKVVQLDDRIELSKSYSIARVLVDCYEWEQINERVKVTVDERSFIVFVKECGSEIYSVQAHSNLAGSTTQFVSSEEDATLSAVSGTPTGIERTFEWKMEARLNLGNGSDPQLEAIIDGLSMGVQPFSSGGGCGKLENGDSFMWLRSTVHRFHDGLLTDVGVCFDELDPMFIEAQTMKPDCRVILKEQKINSLGLDEVKDACSSCSLPFPHGFEPDPPMAHPNHEVNELGGSGVVVESAEPLNVEGVSPSAGALSEGERSDETLYLINKEWCVDLLCTQEVNEGNVGNHSVDGWFLGGLRPTDNATKNDSKNDTRCGDGGGKLAILPSDTPLAEVGAVGFCDNIGNSVNLGSLSDETLYRLNDNFVDVSRRSNGGGFKDIEQGGGGDSIEEDSSAEVRVTKEVWHRGGLILDSRDEEEVRSKLMR
ncbi:hypothetical protein PIB30_068849 [Stylosanthes scabra]|uniref:DUF4283 domain-containing protein n=1 Tax=Stylosanthes scabra TaxID=79078 RepID=A0ABU6QNK1_9FABA|nr:hypothetical protein [Stylosanthes scabra]